MLNKGHGRKVQNTLADNLLPVSGKAVMDELKSQLVYSSNNGKLYKIGNLYTIHGHHFGGVIHIKTERRG